MTTTAAARSGPEPVLVGTKLHAPAVRPDFVPRRELVRRLIAAHAAKLVLVSAPAGWGKTMLLSEWQASHAEDRAFAWVSLDPGDDDPIRFWGYVIAAFRNVGPELGGTALAALPCARSELADAVVAPLVNDVAAAERNLVLVLDDYHVVHAEAIHASVAFLLRCLPPRVQLAIATRADPPLPLARLRAAGDVTEIRAADLRFSRREAAVLLNDSLGLRLEPADVERLRDRCEGWAAGLQLAALSLRNHENAHAFVEAFAGDDRQIGDYLLEVLAEQPPELRDFLLQTSILERLFGSLCDAVTGRNDGAQQLEAVSRANLFLVALDTRREWYRYHQLFRDLLRRELARVAPDLAPKLHRRASAWHRTQRDADAAISHAVAAGDLEDAAELIAQYWDRLFQLGQMETILRWIRALGDEAARADARVCLVYAWCALFLGRHDEAEEWRLAASLAPAPQRLYSTMISIEADATALEASQAYMTGDVGRALDAGRRSVAAHPDHAHFTHWIAKLQLGHALYYAGALDDAADVIEETLPRLSPERWSVLVVIAYGCLAVIRATQGDLEAAGRAAAEAERLVDELQFTEAPWAAQALVGRGKLLDVAGDLAAADTTLARAAVLARRGTRPLVQAHALILLAQIKRRRRDHAGARTAAREARKVLDGCPDSGMLAELLAKVERSLALAPEPSAGEAGGEDELSERELAVLRLLASPLSQREIGSELFISLNTAKGHVRSVFRKPGVSSRRAAVARGRELGLI